MTTGKWHSTCLTSGNPEWRACHFLPPPGKAVSRLSFHWVGGRNYAFQYQKQLGCSSNMELGSEIRASAGGMQV